MCISIIINCVLWNGDYVYQTLRERNFSFFSSGERKEQSNSAMWFVHSGC